MEMTKDSTSATPSEIDQAIERLSADDLQNLSSSAQRLAGKLGHQTQGRGWEDLMQEAVCSTLEGRRHWNREIPFKVHLQETMRSIAWSWRMKRERTGVVDVGLYDPETKRVIDLESPEPAVDRALKAQQELQKIEACFTDDRLASEVIEGWREGFTGPEMQELLGISELEYRATVRRIRRNVTSRFRSQR